MAVGADGALEVVRDEPWLRMAPGVVRAKHAPYANYAGFDRIAVSLISFSPSPIVVNP